jgi:hypothetical protein
MKYLTALVISLILSVAAFSQETVATTLAWDANPEPDIAEYKLKIGTASGVYTIEKVVSADDPLQVVVDLKRDTMHYAVLVAVNTSHQASPASKELVFQVFKFGEGKAPSQPQKPRKEGPLQVSIEESKDLKLWVAIHSQVLETSTPQSFYRLALESK